jgi:phosphotransferase system enzyme I (PtsI)
VVHLGKREHAGEPPAGPAPLDERIEAARIQPAADIVAAALTDEAALASGTAAEILDTVAVMATDPSLIAKAEELVAQRHIPAPRAVYEASAAFVDTLLEAGGYLAERAVDLRDVRDRIVAELTGIRPSALPKLTTPSVLVADDLAPADTAQVDANLVLALVTEQGGPTSHTAILARSLGIPAVVACRGATGITEPFVLVDGDTGEVVPGGEDTVLVADRAPEPGWDGIGRTADGVSVPVLANVGSPQDAETAAAAEGIGLFRTEFCYLAADSEPTVAEQREVYAAVLRGFAKKPVVVRTLDAGSDKPLTFLLPDAEPNPALGVRGIRLSRERPSMMDGQLEAIVGAATDSGADVAVMAPMVSTLEETRWFVARARAAGVRRVGVMIEVPAVALCANEILAEVDFASIGTNDLAQYTMAADRELAAVAGFNDPWQPALLRLIEMVAVAGENTATPIGVCGEAAADPLLACVLVGLGVRSLSMNPAMITSVGATLALHSAAQCRAAARDVLSAPDPVAARTAARAYLA